MQRFRATLQGPGISIAIIDDYRNRSFVNTTILIIAVGLAGLCAIVRAADAPTTEPATPIAVKIVLVGDSTVTEKSGWGTGFAKCLLPEVQCVNLARGGRSSRSFRDEGHWSPVAALKPDYVLIQFGHNDQPGKGPLRETDPKTEYAANLKRYVEEARAAGAKPVLITSLVRRRFNEQGRIQSDLLPYVESCRVVAKEVGAPLIDLHELSIAFCESLGKEGCQRELSPTKEDGAFDQTHLTARGSELIGPIVAAELARVVPELAPLIRLPEVRK